MWLVPSTGGAPGTTEADVLRWVGLAVSVADCLWHVYRVLGKLSGRITSCRWLLSPSPRQSATHAGRGPGSGNPNSFSAPPMRYIMMCVVPTSALRTYVFAAANKAGRAVL
jgi:hypothetical protein